MKAINYVKQFLKQNGIRDLELSGRCKDGSGATFNFETRVLEINEAAMVKESFSLGLSMKDTVSIIVSHELGHYLDSELENLYLKKVSVFNRIKNEFYATDFNAAIEEGTSYVLKAEENAWVLGEKFVPNQLLDKYRKVKNEILQIQENATRAEFQEFISNTLEIERLKQTLNF